MDGWNTSFLLAWPIFGGYVSFRALGSVYITIYYRNPPWPVWTLVSSIWWIARQIRCWKSWSPRTSALKSNQPAHWPPPNWCLWGAWCDFGYLGPWQKCQVSVKTLANHLKKFMAVPHLSFESHGLMFFSLAFWGLTSLVAPSMELCVWVKVSCLFVNLPPTSEKTSSNDIPQQQGLNKLWCCSQQRQQYVWNKNDTVQCFQSATFSTTHLLRNLPTSSLPCCHEALWLRQS